MFASQKKKEVLVNRTDPDDLVFLLFFVFVLFKNNFYLFKSFTLITIILL